MTERLFGFLFDKIKPYMMENNNKKNGGKKPNSDIDLSARLSVALR